MPCVLAGNVAGFTTIGVPTVTLYVRLPVAPRLSVAVTVKLAVPALVAVPVTAPLDPFRLRPAGKAPADTAYVIDPVPPEAVTLCAYATPCVVAGKDTGLILMRALTTTV